MTLRNLSIVVAFAWIASGCAGQSIPSAGRATPIRGEVPDRTVTSIGDVNLGEPLAVALDFDGSVLLGDGSPGRVIRVNEALDRAVEFQRPASNASFYPTDVALNGFFVYALDEYGRRLLRFDSRGAFRDILIDFDRAFVGERVVPAGLAVDTSGRTAVCDVKNHRILVFDTYLQLEIAFGTYGSYDGQFDAPHGLTFTRDGGFLVADTGNGRIQRFDRSGSFVQVIPEKGVPNPLRGPRRVAVDGRGGVYIADPDAGRVFVFDAAGKHVRTVAPDGTPQFRPTSVAVGRTGLLFVTDTAAGALYTFR